MSVANIMIRMMLI